MNIHALKDIYSQVYMIDPMQIANYEFMLDALRNGFDFEPKAELDQFKSFVQDAVMGSTTSAKGEAPQATKIAVHSQRGVMLRDSMGCGHIGTREIGNRLVRYDSEDEVMAQIIIFDTPGGGANSPVEIADAIAKCDKPVYAWVDGYCCSAGIYSASYCTETFAHRDTDVIGSIGTYAEYAGYKNGEKDGQGRTHYRIYATKSENKNKEYEELIQNGNYKLLQDNIDKHRDRFVSDILANRPKATEEEHCHGDTWDASEVVDTLIDGIKTWSELIDHIVAEHQTSNSNSSSSTSSAAHSNNKNNNQMKDLVLLVALMAAAGLQDLELDADGALSLNDEQLTAVNAALETYNSTDVAAIELARDNALAAQATAEQALTDANTAHTTALATAQARIEELEDEDGAQSSSVKPKLDTTPAVVSTDKQAMDDAKALVAAHTAQK